MAVLNLPRKLAVVSTVIKTCWSKNFFLTTHPFEVNVHLLYKIREEVDERGAVPGEES